MKGSFSYFKKQIGLTPSYKRRQKRQIKQAKQRGQQTELEKQIYEEMKRIAEEDFKSGNNPAQKFRFWHLEKALEKFKIIPRPNIRLMYGKKNIGKTGELARKLAQMHAEHPDAQFIFVRNKMQDLSAIEECFKDEVGPVEVVGTKIYGKESKVRGKGSRKSRKQAGIFVWSTAGGFQSIQGSSHKNVRLIIWDECNDTDGAFMTPQTLYKYHVFSSSVIRDKGIESEEDIVETYMIGNLLQKGDQTMNLFLSALKVSPDATLKFIDIHEDGDEKKKIVSRLIYVNTLDLYRGIESQVGLVSQFSSEEDQQSLLFNLQTTASSKSIYSEWDFYKSTPQLSIVFTLKEEGILNTYILYIAKKKNTLIYICWIDKFNPANIKLGYTPVTNELLTTCNFVAPQYLKEKQFQSILKFIANLLLLGQLFYGYNNSLHLFTKFGFAHEGIYQKGKFKTKNI